MDSGARPERDHQRGQRGEAESDSELQGFIKRDGQFRETRPLMHAALPRVAAPAEGRVAAGRLGDGAIHALTGAHPTKGAAQEDHIVPGGAQGLPQDVVHFVMIGPGLEARNQHPHDAVSSVAAR
jgi:hypothetical protein